MLRFFDIILSFIAIVLFLPFFLIISVVLLCTGEHQVLYLQNRVGRGMKLFKVFKLTTMMKNSEKMEGGEITHEHDPRVLPIGAFLRRTKLNELPQLINILKGDMSFVGHRPLVPSQFGMYSEEIQQKLATIKPGLSGIGSIIFRDEEHLMSFSELGYNECFEKIITPYKGELEVWYTENMSIWNYIKIILLTFVVLFKPDANILKSVYPQLPKPNQAMSDLLKKSGRR
ncbi:MAG: sugar transferase [Spirochaetales bacterium]|nr:sugar transferase [Spirochaetales bacterium]